jgi:hypothetical protein
VAGYGWNMGHVRNEGKIQTGERKTRRRGAARYKVVGDKASAYIKELIVCPNGERITRSEKLVALVLAEFHQVSTFPSVRTIAEDSLMDERACRRLLASLERKGVILREHGDRQGRGQTTFYFFPAITAERGAWASSFFAMKRTEFAAPDRPKGPKRVEIPKKKEGTAAPLFLGERRTEGGQKEDKIGAAYKEEQEQEQKLRTTPLPPSADADGGDGPKPAQVASGTAPEGWLLSGQLDAAVKRVADAVGLPTRRARRKLRAVVLQRMELGEAPGEVADRMIAMYEKQEKNSRLLFRVVPPLEFYESGLWISMNRWNWDQASVRDERLRMEARVGSF